MTIDKFDVVFFTLAFVVPGFVWDSVLTALAGSSVRPPAAPKKR